MPKNSYTLYEVEKLKTGFFKREILILLVIVVLASILRLWQLSSTPPSLEWDEAALGYNAYSLLQTGRDEYGTFLPLNLKSFGDYKPAVYAYLDVPFVAIFGLNEFATRFPSALAGIGLVIVVYLLMYELTKNSRLSLLSAFAVAISPLSLQFSRVAFESNISVFFNALSLLLILKGVKNNKSFIPAAIILGISMFTYQSSRLFIPLLLVGVIFLLRKNLKVTKSLISGVVILGLFLGLVGLTLFGFGQSARLATVSVFNYPRSPVTVAQIATEEGISQNTLAFQFLHGEWFAYLKGILERYFIYYSPKTLFIQSDQSPRHSVPDLGTLYYYSAFLIPVGMYFLWKKRSDNPNLTIIFWYFLIAPIPAILARDLIDMIRTLNIVVPLSIFEGAGLYVILRAIFKKRKMFAYPLVFALGILMITNIAIYLDRYYVHMPTELSEGWVYGYKRSYQLAGLTDPNAAKKYDHVVVDDEYGQPYIFYLFYSKYPPQDFQKQAVLDQPNSDVGTVRKIDNVEFRKVNWGDDSKLTNALLIGAADDLPAIPPAEVQHKVIGKVNFLDGKEAFKIVYAP